MEIKKILESKSTKSILIMIGGLIFTLIIFQAGVFVGFHKARFSYQWGDNYHRAFGGPRGGFMQDFQGKEFINGHGTAGTIISLDNDKIIVKDKDGAEKIIMVDEKTAIRAGKLEVKVTDLKPEQSIVVIGSPNDDGTIKAQLIRVFDADDSNRMPRPDFNFNPLR